MRMAWLALLCIVLAGCGSGSERPGTDGKILLPDVTTGTARLEIGTEGPTPQSVLYAAEFNLRLPDGITVPTTPDGLVAPGVLVPALSGSYAGAAYSTATATAAGALHVEIANPDGFTVGPLAAITCVVAPGTEPAPAAFAFEGFSARDANGAPLSGITPRLTAVVR